MRSDGRNYEQLRPLQITRSYLRSAEGSALIELGGTRVICAATVEEKIPHFLKGRGQGWVTAEFGMLPRATAVRLNRERNSANSRSLEIQRLIGRSLRAVVDLAALGERTITLDCDVLEADGGTRTASVSGAFVALAEALYCLTQSGRLEKYPLSCYLSAVSVGLLDGQPLLDLAFKEDSAAEVDMNGVMAAGGRLVEVQGSAEGSPFDRAQLNRLLDLAEIGIKGITAVQQAALGEAVDSLIGGSFTSDGTSREEVL